MSASSIGSAGATPTRTWRDYQYDLKQFVEIVGDRPPATINRRLAAIESFYAFLSAEEPTLVCPVLPHRHSLRELQRLPRPMQTDVLDKFLAVITDVRDRAMFVLILRCGLRIAERLNSKIKAVVFTQGTSLIFLLLMGFSPALWLSGVAFLIRGALMNLSNPLYSAFAMEQTPERERGAVNSVMQLMGELGWTVGPYLSGVVQARWGFSPLFVATTVLYGGAIGLTWLFFRHADVRLPSPEKQLV